MNHTSYQITKDYLRETHAQAYRDYLARSLQPSFRQRLANLLTKVALRLEGKTRAESVEFAPTPNSSGWVVTPHPFKFLADN